MNKGSIGGRHVASRKFQVFEGKRDVATHTQELENAVVDLIELHDRGLISAARATGQKPAIVFGIYKNAMRERIGKAYVKGFREGRLSPVQPLRPAA